MCGAPVRDKAVEYNVVSSTLMGTACLVVLVRLAYKQFFTSVDLALDDWFILLTLINAAPSAIINVSMLTANGLGKDIWTLTPDEITNFSIAFYIIAILYFSEVFVLKLSMLFFYLRIFPARNIRRVIWGTIAFDILFGVAFILTAVFQCRPISYNWTSWRGEGGGQCVNISTIAWANAAISIVLDIWMLAIPLWQLRDLRLHWKKKVGVALMFCVGTFVTVLSIIRLASLVQFRESSNLTWDYWSVSLFSTIEIAVGIICACMPSIRLILVRVAPKIFESSLVQRTGYYSKKGRSANAENTTAKSNGASRSDSSKIGANTQDPWRPHVRTSWRVSHSPHDPSLVDDGVLSPVISEFEGNSDTRQLVPMRNLSTMSKGKSEVKITSRRIDSDTDLESYPDMNRI
ncbi:CFEM domain-containing protein [Xylariales sp. AK1849]|nr:CFEM domain-containing protein [Xylariales sp. AK1849]